MKTTFVHFSLTRYPDSWVERMVKDGAEMTCVSNSLKRIKDGYIGLETEVKRFKAALNPRKRFFTGNHSLAWE